MFSNFVTPQIPGVFFFVTIQVCRDREIAITTEYLCHARASVMRAFQSHAHACRACPALSWVTGHLCHARLCHIATSLSLAQCSFPVVTQINSVTTWDLLTMIELCRDLKFSCRDLVSTTYTFLCRDKEKSCCDIESPFLACRNNPGRARSALSCARPER